MSRIGKKPIPIPKGVTITVAAGAVEVQGPKGQLPQVIPPGLRSSWRTGSSSPARARDAKRRKFHGLARSLVANAVTGVTEGFKKELESSASATARSSRASRCIRPRLFAPDRVRHPDRDRYCRRKADAHHRDRRRPAAGRARWRRTSAGSASPIRTSRRACVHRRSAEEEGRQDRSK